MSSVPETAESAANTANTVNTANAMATGATLADADAQAWAGLSARVAPLLLHGRLDNLVDLLALMADVMDFLDPAMVEKASLVFEESIAAHATLGGALRLAAAQGQREADPPGARALWALAHDADTRRGMALLLRTVQIIGRGQAPAG